ncbi:HAD family hydrolase [Paractinoplanes hotanensis]|uniref:HAD family hydrolase n=1 Tax=Paractinoplanes hotanensis TaxID=2906497 RepID=A0ABT0Y8Y7_9ACTN|nr:HAD family hydrolase [Actinoplanes hotanensis]MCM4082510.1 HAD family hydrolase [Actinoplanes hotanensis]
MRKAILLDVFGTLVRDDGAGAAAIAAEVAARSGATADEVAREWETRLWAMAETAYGEGFRTLDDLNAGSLAAAAAHFGVRVDAPALCRAAQDPSPALFPDARPFLDAVDVPVCLVSDADRDHLDGILERLGITVDHVVTSEDARAYKPRPEPFETALRLLGAAPADVVHIGDSPASDLLGAAGLGIPAIFVNRTGRDLPDGLYPLRTVPSLSLLSS